MKNKWILPAAAVMCILTLSVMIWALLFGGKSQKDGFFTPPAFEPAAVKGVPKADASLGWSEIYQEGMGFKACVCGNVMVHSGQADVYFTNCEGFDVWMKLRILDNSGNILGETGLIKPGEYVKAAALLSDVKDGQEVKLKIMAYEPDTYYSAGAVTLNTTIQKEGAG